MLKRVNYYHFEQEIVAQLQGHYVYYDRNKRVIEREIMALLAESILNANKFIIPSNYELYLPVLKTEKGFARKKQQQDWMTLFKKNGVSYAIISTKNEEIIKRIKLLGKIDYNNITRIEFMFFKTEKEWFFPTHVMVESESQRSIVQILKNSRINQALMKSYIFIIKKINKDVAWLVQNRHEKIIKRYDNKNQIIGIPEVFLKQELPVYSKQALNTLREQQELKASLLKKLLSSVIKN